jgi:hypothetical protein
MLSSMKHESFPIESSPQLRPGADFLRFAVTVAQLDLERLRQGDWLNLREEFELYMGQASLIGASGNCILAYPVKDGVHGSSMVWPLPHEFTPQDFQALKEQILPLVQSEANGVQWATMYPVCESTVLHGLHRSTPGRRQLVISAPATACFLRIFAWLIGQEPPERILACPECGRYFYRVKQQAYCSRACGNRLVVRNYRKRLLSATSTGTGSTSTATLRKRKAPAVV